MIKQETYQINGRNFIRTYSDSNRYVVREGVSYSEANDPAEFDRTYTEGDYMDGETMAEEVLNALEAIL